MSHVSDRKVNHEGPLNAPIFIVGEAPGATENVTQRPFVGQSGDLLNTALSNIGLSRADIRIGNVLNYQPAKNNFALANSTWQLEEGRREMMEYLQTHQHKVIVPMGNRALEFFTGYNKIEKHRGSVYRLNNAWVIGTIHPAAVLRDGSHTPAFMNDLLRAKTISENGWCEPKFNFSYPVNGKDHWAEAESWLEKLREAPRLWCDIESRKYTNYIRCMGFATSKTDAICVFNDSWDSMGPRFARFLRLVLESDNKKTFHNGFFDTTMLARNGVLVNGWDYDTMLMQHSLQPELPLGLDYCTSMYTHIPYYKDDGKETGERIDPVQLAVYNCKDVVATCWTEEGQREEADDVAWLMFQNKFAQVALQRELTECGLLYDPIRQDELSGIVLERRSKAYSLLLYIMEQNNVPQKDWFVLGQHKKVQDFLYRVLELPTQTKQDGAVTADEDAIVKLLGHVKRKLQELKTEKARQPWGFKFAALKLILEIREYEKLLSSYIDIDLSPDNRARSVYNTTGTETDRWSASKYWDNTGLNGQTFPRVSL